MRYSRGHMWPRQNTQSPNQEILSQIEPNDILVLTVISPELAASLKAMGFSKRDRIKDPDGTVYFRKQVRSALLGGRRYSVVLLCIGQAGNDVSGAMAGMAIERFRPKAVFLLGIAGGLRGKVCIGEALFSERVVKYEPAAYVGKKTKAGRGLERSREELRPDTERLSHSMNQDLTAWLIDSDRIERANSLFAKIGGQFPTPPRGQKREYQKHVAKSIASRFATLASGEKLFRDQRKILALRSLHGKIEAVEMEAGGIVEACRIATVPWLVVRGVSDFGDHLKNDQFHEFASLAAAVVLADFIGHGLQLYPSSSKDTPPTGTRINVRPYIDGLKSRLATSADSIPRLAYHLAGSPVPPVTISPTNDPSMLCPATGEAVFISGWSGRGKTTALRMLALRALEESPERIPIFLRPTATSNLATLVRDALGFASSISDHSIASWLGKIPTLFLVDDWHRLTDAARMQFEKLATEWVGTRCALVVSGTGSIVPPKIHNFQYLELRSYAPAEREQVIRNALKDGPNDAGHILSKLPPGLSDVMCEPVLLAKLLQIVQPLRRGIFPFPVSVPELFHRLLETLVESRYGACGQRADEISCVSSYLANGTAGVTLEQVNDAIEKCGFAGTSSAFVEDMIGSGLWTRVASGLYAFEQESWRAYFRARDIYRQKIWSTTESIREWIRSTPEDDLRLILPFAVGLIADYSLLDALHQALLGRNVELYCRTLSAWSKPREPNEELRGLNHLQQIRQGYLEFVDRCIPGLRSFLEPWSQGKGDEEKHGQKVVIGGVMTDVSIQYYFGFAPCQVSDAFVEPARAFERPRYSPSLGHCIHSSAQRKDARPEPGRLAAARLLMSQVEELCKKRQLPPVGWIGRERFRTLVCRLGQALVLEENWHNLSVADVVICAKRLCTELHLSEPFTTRSSYPHSGNSILTVGLVSEPISLDEVIALGTTLTDAGHGDTRIWDLGLPTSKKKLRSRWLSETYSKSEKIARVCALYQAVVETYRSLCEDVLPGLREHLFYAQFPCRPVVQLNEAPGIWMDVGWELKWEVVQDWEEAKPRVSIGTARSTESDQLADQMRADCARFNRKFVQFSVSNMGPKNFWLPWSEAVTDEVLSLLMNDLKILKTSCFS